MWQLTISHLWLSAFSKEFSPSSSDTTPWLSLVCRWSVWSRSWPLFSQWRWPTQSWAKNWPFLRYSWMWSPLWLHFWWLWEIIRRMGTSIRAITIWPLSSSSLTLSLSAWALLLWERWRAQAPRHWRHGQTWFNLCSWGRRCCAWISPLWSSQLCSRLSTGWCSSAWHSPWSAHRPSNCWPSRTRQPVSSKS